MKRGRRPWLLFIPGVLSLAALSYLVYYYPPDYQFLISNFQIPVLPVWFVLLFIAVYGIFSFFLNSKRRGFMLSLFAVIYLLLRLNGLTHLLFLLLLIVLFGLIELFYIKRK